MIIDEGKIAGLKYEVNIDAKFRLDMDNGDTSHKQEYTLSVTGWEASIPWDLLLKTGRGKTDVGHVRRDTWGLSLGQK